MRLLAISDLHGDLESAREAVARFAPDALLSSGDGGDTDQGSEVELAGLAASVPVISTFGNHDPIERLGRLRDRDGSTVLLTHGCAVGLADRTPGGARGGHRCFLDANRAIAPRVHLCGHHHRAQEYQFQDGRQMLNVGATPDGSVVVIDVGESGLTTRLDRFERKVRS